MSRAKGERAGLLPRQRRMSRFPRSAASLLASLLLATWLVATASAASASCAVPAVRSPHQFTGAVVQTANGGRTATVRTDEGTTVTVTGAESGAVSPVDRRYKTGVRYEFHPLNDSSPYRDNACTATRELGPAEGTAGAEQRSGSALPYGLTRWHLLAVLGLGALAVAVGLLRRSVRAPGRVAS